MAFPIRTMLVGTDDADCSGSVYLSSSVDFERHISANGGRFNHIISIETSQYSQCNVQCRRLVLPGSAQRLLQAWVPAQLQETWALALSVECCALHHNVLTPHVFLRESRRMPTTES